MQTHNKKVRSVLLPLSTHSLLLPHSAMLEVIPERMVEPIKNASSWVLGEFSWNHQKIPLIAAEDALINEVSEKPKRMRIVILACLSQEHGYNYLAIRTTGVPRLIQLEDNSFEEKDLGNVCEDYADFFGVLNHQTVIVPNMKAFEDNLFDMSRESKIPVAVEA